MAQWDMGIPALWAFGAGRGFLKVARIFTRHDLDAEIRALEARSQKGDERE
jgi:hypothetical protein